MRIDSSDIRDQSKFPRWLRDVSALPRHCGEASSTSRPLVNRELGGKTRAFAAVVILSNAFGNLLLTWGIRHGTDQLTLSPLSFLRAIFNPWVALGISLLIIWLLSRMMLLSWADLSYVLPVTASGYAVSVMLGRVFLQEQITPARWTGTLLIVCGTVLVSLGNPHTGERT